MSLPPLGFTGFRHRDVALPIFRWGKLLRGLVYSDSFLSADSMRTGRGPLRSRGQE